MEARFNDQSLEEFLNTPGDYQNERSGNTGNGRRRGSGSNINNNDRVRRRTTTTLSIMIGENGQQQQGVTVEGFIDIENDSLSSLSDLDEDGDRIIQEDEDSDSESIYSDEENEQEFYNNNNNNKSLEMDNLYHSIHNNIFSNIYLGGELTEKQKLFNQEHIDIISDLPYEVLAFIFQTLDVRTLLNIALVSKLFYKVQNSYSVWRPKCKTSNVYNRDLFTLEQSTFYTTIPKILNNSQDNSTSTTTTTTTTTTTSTSTSPNSYYSPPILSNSSKTTLTDLKSSFMTTRTVRLYTDELEPFQLDNQEDISNEDMKIDNQEKKVEQEEEEEKFTIKICEWKKLYFELGSIKFYGSFDLISTAIESSSCDSPSQSIHNTLVNSNAFWSSKGTPSSHDSEYLIYKLEQPICIVSSVRLLAYQASFQSGFPIYAPMGVVISVGFSPDNMHYRSQLFGCKQTDKPQTFKLEPELVVGGYIRIDLVGKYQTQFNDKLYYHAINHIGVEGQSIGSLDSKPSLSLSLLQFYSKFKDPSSLVNYSINNINQGFNIDGSVIMSNDIATGKPFTYNQIISKLRSYMAPKLDKERIKKHNLYTVVQDIVEGRYQDAITNIFKNDLRSEKVFNIFLQASDNKAISNYYSALLESLKRFSHEETMFLANEAFSDGNVNIFTRLLLSGRLKASQELGEFILMNGFSLIAAEVFSQCQILDRTIQCLFIAGCHEEALIYTRNYSRDYPLDLVHFIKLFCQYSLYQGCSFTITFIEFLNQIRNEQQQNNDTDDIEDPFNPNNNNNNNEGIEVQADRIGNIFGLNIQDPSDTNTLVTELKKLKSTLKNVKPPRTPIVVHSRLSEFFNHFTQTNGSNVTN